MPSHEGFSFHPMTLLMSKSLFLSNPESYILGNNALNQEKS